MAEEIANTIITKIQNSIIDFLKLLLGGIITNSFWICLFIAMISLILYIAGIKKAGKYCTASFVIYIVLEALGSAFL